MLLSKYNLYMNSLKNGGKLCSLFLSMTQLREETEKADADQKKKDIEIKNPGHGYGGKFGIEKDRMDKSAVGHDYVSKGRF